MGSTTRLATKKLALAAMFCGLGVVFLYFGSLLDVMNLTMVAIASLFVFCSEIEMGRGYSLLIYAVTSVLSMLLLPDKFTAFAYLGFGGIYPILKQVFERLPKWLSRLLKLLYFNAVLAALILISLFILKAEDMSPLYLIFLVLVGNVAFLAYDYAMEILIAVYRKKLRKRLRIQKYFEK